MRPVIPMIGKKFGSVAVLSESYIDKYGNYFYEVQCDCGNKRIVNGSFLRKGKVNGCSSCSSKLVQTHGMSGDPIYSVWTGILSRRRDEVSERWLTFDNFYQDMNPRPEGFWLLRKDPNKKFCKENCYWSFRKKVFPLPKKDTQLSVTQQLQDAADTISACYQDENGEDAFLQFNREEHLEQELQSLIDRREKEFQTQEIDALSDVDNARGKLAKVEIIKRMFKEIMG